MTSEDKAQLAALVMRNGLQTVLAALTEFRDPQGRQVILAAIPARKE